MSTDRPTDCHHVFGTTYRDDRGIRCPACQCIRCPVVKTRHRGNSTQRIRKCKHCSRRFLTVESITSNLVV